MVLARSTPKGGGFGGANAQGRHFVSTDPRAILPSLCFNRVSSRRKNGFVGTRDPGLWFRRHTPPRLVLTSGERLRQRARHLAFDLNLPLSRSDLQRRARRGVHPSSGGNLQ